jgi:transcriptional regulator with XRE-family HTH domain
MGDAVNNSNLANELKLQRAKRKWSQEQLAMISKVSINEIHKIENAKNVPRMITLIKLANALGIDEEIFLKYIR